jgi:hypothetical protein
MKVNPMQDYLCFVSPYFDEINAAPYDIYKDRPNPSGIFMFVVEAGSEQDAVEKCKPIWKHFKIEIDQSRYNYTKLYRECRLLGYHEDSKEEQK